MQKDPYIQQLTDRLTQGEAISDDDYARVIADMREGRMSAVPCPKKRSPTRKSKKAQTLEEEPDGNES